MTAPAYLFRAALLCQPCGLAYMAAHSAPAWVNMNDESSYDSDDWPKGPFPNGGGESDSPCFCDHCGAFLQNPLTPDGLAYVSGLAAEGRLRPDLIQAYRHAI